ncbi:hypothetical protein [Micromonospora sp. AB353]|uniref:hypothetical protein n=1 Tax=Micromonospora sp. AB353 TaxID=3413282 RepID=UPI003C177212
MLAGLVPDRLAEGYSTLVSHGTVDLTGSSPVEDRDLVEDLVDWGLARRQGTVRPELRPVEPLVALESSLEHLHEELARRHRALLDGHHRLRELQRDYFAGGADGPTSQPFRVLSDDEVLDVTVGMANTATEDAMAIVNDTDGAIMSTIRSDVAMRRDQPVRKRVLYDPSALSLPDGTADDPREAPEEMRALSGVPLELHIVDERAAVIPLRAGSYLFIRSRLVTRALRHYFELLWQRARPLGEHRQEEGHLTRAQHDVLVLMSCGLKDEAIARRTGMSVRTVRRHVGVVMDLLSADTRFAAGVEAQRRGWL